MESRAGFFSWLSWVRSGTVRPLVRTFLAQDPGIPAGFPDGPYTQVLPGVLTSDEIEKNTLPDEKKQKTGVLRDRYTTTESYGIYQTNFLYGCNFLKITLPKMNSSPLKPGNPNGNGSSSSPIHF